MKHQFFYSRISVLFLLLFKSIFPDKILLAQTNIPRIIPRDNFEPFNVPENPAKPPPEFPVPSTPESPQLDNNINNTIINVRYFDFSFNVDNPAFSIEELKQIPISSLPENPKIGDIKNQKLSYNQLVEIAQQVADFYNKEGYVTSGAIAIIPPEIKTNPNAEVVIKIQVLEGEIEQIEIRESNTEKEGRLANYIRNRLGVQSNQSFNVKNLLQSLQLLQIDPLIKSINAQLSVGSEQGKSILYIKYVAANSFNPKLSFENNRPPSIGTIQREIELTENNLLGLGDSINISYKNTDGSNRIDGNYTVPINPENGTIGIYYTWSDNNVIQYPFFDIDSNGKGPDIESNYNAFDLVFRQPIIRKIEDQTYKELSLSLTTSWRETQSYLFGDGYALSPGAEADGKTRVFALRFTQEYIQQNPSEVIAFRSEFNLGLDAFNSTINEQISGVEYIPDSSFFAWRGQAQYVKLFAPDTLFLARSNIQLTGQNLLPMEEFSIGGFGSVRGYPQDFLVTDNGWFASVEFRYPILRVFEGQGVFQIIPFFDYGIGWNSSNIPNPNPQNLASLGVGLQYRYNNNFFAKIEYGIPLISIDIDKNSWQEKGIYFSIQYFPFAD